MAGTGPLITYTITLNGGQIASGNNTVSYKSGHNQINISLNSDRAVSYYEARITCESRSEAYGIGTGVLAYSGTDLAANTTVNKIITVNSTTFPTQGSTDTLVFRIGLYAKSTSNGFWDVTYILTDNIGQIICDSSNNQISVYADDSIPS